MTPDLKVFISSKEGELESERLIVKKVIESLLLNPVSSEDRSATFRAIKEVNEKEVRSSHIYIGLFKGEYSEATIDEFELARSIPGKIIFIFKKYQKESEHRDDELKKFLKEIEDPNRGIVTEYFINIFDLKSKVKKAIMEFLSDYYITRSSIEIDTPSKATIVNNDIEYIDNTGDTYKAPHQIKIVNLTDSELIKFGFNLSNKYYNKVKIEKVLLPDFEKDSNLPINVEIFGTVSKGFLDLFIRDSENNDLWFPDEGTWDKNNDQGTLELKEMYISRRWSFKIPSYTKKNFKIYVLVFEDSDGHTLDKRKVVTGVEVLLDKKT